MAADEPGDRERQEPSAQDEPSFSDQVGAAIRGSKLGQLDPAAKPSANALLGAMGGVRGLIESLLPGILFLVLYATTKSVWISVLVPLAVSIGFVAWRVLQKGQPVLAFAGLIGVGISAAVALITGQGEDNFLWGFTVNTIVILVLVISMLMRKPLVGVIAGALTGTPHAWRTERAKRAVAWRATILWLIVIGARLAVQVPLYFAETEGLPGAIELLAGAKLLMGVPLYLAALWVTWLMVRTVLESPDADTPADPEGSGKR
ncbi:DUF3159 domain-containing protein [Agrococcus sp. ARC_14]|uniref:DUF3159 domain-containing protein n=1 Tax=Agrococcus sp. ARC_14 TaxID=2919927 RepID=UPI001F06F733|nr:DUF3159 domain-containing protein [Agrococcus sp. ARC_14]MCH1883022.1 DUF3159 domain-containing protein [Agrococcus sp. ARC_14]